MTPWLKLIVWPLLRRHWLPGLLVVLLASQQVSSVLTRRGLERQLAESRRQTETLTRELAQTRQAMTELKASVAALKPGEARTIYVDPNPALLRALESARGQILTVEKQVPVVVTRTEHTVETRVQTVELPGREIERIIRESPQSIVATMTALRDIRQGEQFSATFAQIQPGIWQPLVTPGSPVGIEARVITPVERIPAPPAPEARLSLSLYGGYSTLDQWVTGLRGQYRLTPHLRLEGQAEHRWRSNTQDYRLLFSVTF